MISSRGTSSNSVHFDQSVEILDVGFLVLSVVEIDSATRNHRFERVIGIGESWLSILHDFKFYRIRINYGRQSDTSGCMTYQLNNGIIQMFTGTKNRGDVSTFVRLIHPHG